MNIVIIGGTGGIGSEILSNFTKKGDDVFIGSLNQTKIIEHSKTFNCGGDTIDVTNMDNFESFFYKENKHLNGIDAIINCVGSVILKPSHMASKDEIYKTYQLNIFNSIGTIKYGVDHLRHRGGSIILFSSAAANIGLKNHDIISSAKGAINSLVKSAAMSYANYDIRINAVAPGLVDTPLTSKIINNDAALKYSTKMHPLNRIGKPKNIYGCVEWLVAPDSDWVTGQTITLDGGLSSLKY